jgi:hypothetical protein
MRSINLLILFGVRRNCLRSGRSRLFYLSIRELIKQTVVIIGAYHFFQLRTSVSNTLLTRLTPYAEENILGIINVDFDATGKLLIIYSAFIKYLKKNWNKMKQCISCL